MMTVEEKKCEEDRGHSQPPRRQVRHGETQSAQKHQLPRSSCSSRNSSAFLRMNSALLVGTNLYFPRTCRGAPAGLVFEARSGPTLLCRIKDLRTSPTISRAWSKDGVGP